MEDFAISYPESMNYFADYYASYNALCNEEESELSFIERKYGLLVFAPMIIIEDDKEATLANGEKFDASGSDLSSLRKQYKNLVNKVQKYNSSDVLSLITLVNHIEDDILLENKNKYQIFRDYGITSERFDQCVLLSQYKDKLEEILLENSFGYYDKLTELCELIPYFLKNGIQYGDENIRFTLLDYYYLTGEKVPEFIDKFKRTHIAKNEQEVMKKLNVLKNNEFSLGNVYVDSETMANSGIKVSIAGHEQVVDFNFAEKIMGLFKEFNIPVRDSLVQIAAVRCAKGQPILPIEDLRREKIENKEIGKVLVYSKGE